MFVGDPTPDPTGPWHLDVSFDVWNRGEKPTSIQDVAVSVQGRRYEPGDYGYFKPTTLEPGGTKQELWFRAYPDDESFVPDWSDTVDGLLLYQLSKGRPHKLKVKVAPRR